MESRTSGSVAKQPADPASGDNDDAKSALGVGGGAGNDDESAEGSGGCADDDDAKSAWGVGGDAGGDDDGEEGTDRPVETPWKQFA